MTNESRRENLTRIHLENLTDGGVLLRVPTPVLADLSFVDLNDLVESVEEELEDAGQDVGLPDPPPFAVPDQGLNVAYVPGRYVVTAGPAPPPGSSGMAVAFFMDVQTVLSGSGWV